MKAQQKQHTNIPPRAGVGIRNISDYSPFGVLLKERTVETANFRYSFQGQECDPEIKGEGNSLFVENKGDLGYEINDCQVEFMIQGFQQYILGKESSQIPYSDTHYLQRFLSVKGNFLDNVDTNRETPKIEGHEGDN